MVSEELIVFVALVVDVVNSGQATGGLVEEDEVGGLTIVVVVSLAVELPAGPVVGQEELGWVLAPLAPEEAKDEKACGQDAPGGAIELAVVDVGLGRIGRFEGQVRQPLRKITFKGKSLSIFIMHQRKNVRKSKLNRS